MAQPQAYNREVDFTERDGDDTNHAGINAEMDAAALSINQLRDNLALIQKDDGGLQPGIVTAESLAPSAFDAVQGQLSEAVNDAQEAAGAATLAATTALGARDAANASAIAAAQSSTNAATSAAGAATAAQTIFNGLYLGAQAADPTTDLNGQPLNSGDFYYNSAAKLFRAYDASLPGFTNATPSGQFKRPKFEAGTDFTPGTTTTLTLESDPITSKNMFVFFDGIAQHNDQFSTSGMTLTFTSPIPLGVVAVEVAYLEALGLNVPADGSVSTGKLANGAVTNDKVAADANIDSSKLALTAKLAQPTGDTLVGSDDGAGGSLWTTVAGFIARQQGERQGVNVLRYIPPAEWAAIQNGTTTFDCTAYIQSAIDAMQGLYQPTVLTALAQGSDLYFPSGTYLITAPLVVTKSASRLHGAGWNSTIIKYAGTGLVPELIRFKDSNNSELSRVRLDGAATSGSQGAKAGLGIDLAAFFTSHDIFITGTTHYGLRASHLWESYFSNTYIRKTGLYSTAGAPGSSIYFGSADATSTVFPGHEANNTTFVKPTLAGWGGQVRIDASAGGTDNISFIDPVCESDFNIPTTQRNENIWHLEGTNNNFRINGGFYTSNDQPAAGTGYVFYSEADLNGSSIKDFTVTIRKTSGFSRHSVVALIASYRPIEIDITVIDKQDLLSSVLRIGGQTWTSYIYGNISYTGSGGTPRSTDWVFFNAYAKTMYKGGVVVANGNNTDSFGNNTQQANQPIAYQEGTWTPNYVTTGTAFGSVTYDAITGGKYTRIGNMVFVQGVLRTSALTVGSASGDVRVGGLPFIVAANTGSTANGNSAISIAIAAGFVTSTPSHGPVIANTYQIGLYFNVAGNPMLPVHMGTGAGANSLRFSACYITA